MSGRNFSLFHAYPRPAKSGHGGFTNIGVFGRAVRRAHYGATATGSLAFLRRARTHHRAKMRRSYAKSFSRRGTPYM